MFRRLSLLLLTSAAAPAALAQASSTTPVATPSTTPAAAAPVQYGVAFVTCLTGTGCKVAIQDGVTLGILGETYEENGRTKRFANEGAVLNFLAAQGWEITPYGGESNRYFLKRRAR